MRGSVFVRDQRVLWRRIVDGVLLLPANDEEMLTVGGAGVHVWELLASPHTAATAAVALSTEFGRPSREIAAEIESAIAELAARGAVRRVTLPTNPTQPEGSE